MALSDVNEGSEQPDEAAAAAAAGAESQQKDTPSEGAGGKSADDDVLLSGDGDEGAADAGVPDEYTFEITDEMKDLVDPSKLDDGTLDAFKTEAKELGLSQEQFQKLIEYDVKRTTEAAKAASDGYAQRMRDWAEAVKSDKALGGENTTEVLKTADVALSKLGTPELVKLLKAPSAENPEGLGLGNHPEFVRFAYRVGQLFADPSLVQGAGESATQDRNSLRNMYPTMFDKGN